MEQDSTSNNDLKYSVNKESLLFYVTVEGKDLVVSHMPSSKLATLLTDERMVEESTKLKQEYFKVTGQEKDLDYFDRIVFDINKKLLGEVVEKATIEGKRFKAFLIYHLRTLMSIKNNVEKGQLEGLDYVTTELRNMSNIKSEELFKILDAIIEKKRKK